MRPALKVVGATFRRNVGFLVVLGGAAVLRVWIELARLPNVYQDSVIYMRLSEHAPFAPYSPSRPSGYPMVMRLVRAVGGPKLDLVTSAQHLAGLAVGVLVYTMLIRAGTRRWLATIVAAVVLFDAYAVALEQDILAESFFTLAITACVWTALRGEDWWLLALSGLLLALATTMRTVGLFAVPVWLVWILCYRRDVRTVLAGVAALMIPLLVYGTLHANEGVGFSLMDSDGWYLYAKVGPIVDCSRASIPAEARVLCVKPVTQDTNYYLYNPSSPAYQLFFGNRPVDIELEGMTHHNNDLLRRFSLGIIRAHPVSFSQVVAKDFFRYLGSSPAPVELSVYGKQGSLLGHYERWVHLWWWIVAPAAAVGVAGLVWVKRRRETALIVGTALALLVGASATAGFNIRYVVPVAPLLLAGACIAGQQSLAQWRSLSRPYGGNDSEGHR